MHFNIVNKTSGNCQPDSTEFDNSQLLSQIRRNDGHSPLKEVVVLARPFSFCANISFVKIANNYGVLMGPLRPSHLCL